MFRLSTFAGVEVCGWDVAATVASSFLILASNCLVLIIVRGGEFVGGMLFLLLFLTLFEQKTGANYKIIINF